MRTLPSRFYPDTPPPLAVSIHSRGNPLTVKRKRSSAVQILLDSKVVKLVTIYRPQRDGRLSLPRYCKQGVHSPYLRLFTTVSQLHSRESTQSNRGRVSDPIRLFIPLGHQGPLKCSYISAKCCLW